MTYAPVWDDDRVERLRNLVAKKFPQRDIARSLGVSLGAVQDKMRKLQISQSTSVTNWPPERDELLRTLLAEGRSHSEIGKALGVSRNASIGRARRLGLGMPRPPSAPKVRAAPARARPNWRAGSQAVATGKAKAKIIIAGGGAVFETTTHTAPLPSTRGELTPLVASLEHLGAHHCKWPIGNGPFAFCGRGRAGEGPYCDAHHARAFNGFPEQRKHRRAA